MTADAPATRARARRTWPQRLLIVFNLGVMSSFLFTAAGLGYVYTKFGRLPRVEIGQFLTEAEEQGAGGPQNFLIVGVDSAEGLDPDDPVRATRGRVGGLRSDTMMILRVDPASTRAALLSIPRDLYVPVSGTRGSGRINSAVDLGGPQRLIETIQDHFGVPINHYVQVDFYGFRRLVAAIDGVPVYFPHPVRDAKTGLVVAEPGCVVLDPAMALGYVRSRSYQEQIDGRWRTDPTGDIGRIRRQQDFIQKALRRAVERGLSNPVTLDEMIDSAIEAIAVDDTLRGADVLDLARSFRTFQPENLDLYALPVEGDSVGGASILRLIEREAQPILDIFRGTDASALTESAVQVTVLNGSGVPGQAAEARDELRDAGFATGATGDAGRFEVPRTEVRHPPGGRAGAELLARWLEGGALLIEDGDVSGVTLVTGLDFDGIRAEPVAAEETTSTTSTTLPRLTTTTVEDRDPDDRGDGTTTTLLGTVPAEAPPGVDCD